MLKRYVAVRQTETGEWMDLETLSFGPETAKIKAQGIDADLPGWARKRPVVRVAMVQVTEVAA